MSLLLAARRCPARRGSLQRKIPPSVQGRREAPRYHPACLRESRPLGRANGRSAPGYWDFTGRACPGMDGRRVRPGDAPRASCRASTFPGSLTDGLLLLPWPHIELSGGPSGIRTHDLLNAIETRSQLRYGPIKMDPVDLAGFEPATSSVRLRRAPAAPQAPIEAPYRVVEIVLE